MFSGTLWRFCKPYLPLMVLAGIWCFLRTVVWFYVPEQVSVKYGLPYSVLGTVCDFFPLMLFLCIGTKIFRLLACGYVALVTCCHVANAIFIVESRRIVDYDLLVAITGNTLLSGLAALPVSLYLVLCVILLILICFVKYISRYIYIYIYLKKTVALLLLIPLFLGCVCYDYKYSRGALRREWIARPIYQNIFLLFRDYCQATLPPEKKPSYPVLTRKDLFGNTAAIAPATVRPEVDTVIFIAVESLDLAYLHTYNKAIPEECTLFLDSCTELYPSFSNFFTTSLPTIFGTHSILTSRLDILHDDENLPSLFTVMRDHGWETYFIAGISSYFCKEGPRFIKRYKPEHAFFSEYFEEKYGIFGEGWGMDSSILFNEAEKIITSQHAKKFIYISTIDTHPFYGKKPDSQDICMHNSTIIENRFLLSLCAIDRKLEQFIHRILKISPKTLIFISSDHSASHGDNFTQRDNFDPDRIPLLIISNTDITGYFPRTNKNYCSQIDIAPTIAHMCGMDLPSTFLGVPVTHSTCSISRIDAHRYLVRDATGEKILFPYGD